MAGSFSDYAETNVLGLIIGQTAYTVPATYYVGLWGASLTDASTGATAGEPSGLGYARIAVTNNATNFPAPSGGSNSNGTAITFANATGSWGVITHVGLLDSITTGAGNLIAWSDLASSVTVGNGDSVVFNIGALVFTMA